MGTAEQLQAVADASGDQVVAVVGDATSLAVVSQAIESAEAHFGGVDAVIAAAGVVAGGVPQWEMPEHEQQAVLDIDLGGVLVAARAGIPALLRRPAPAMGGSWPWPRPPPPGACPCWPSIAQPRPAWSDWSEAWLPSSGAPG